MPLTLPTVINACRPYYVGRKAMKTAMRSVLKKTALILISVISVFSVLILASGIYMQINDPEPRNNSSGITLNTPSIAPFSEENTLISREDMLENALESVVGISSADSGVSGDMQSWYMGSGVIATQDGYIITNQHVIGARPQRIVVTLHDGKTTEGKTVWSDSTLDLAVVKIDGSGYRVSKLGDAKKLRVGESVIAIGNPLSMQFERTVTAGIVSALGRSIKIEAEGRSGYMEDLIQTDASINPGNSGGPLLNLRGEVVGINTVKVSTAEGMGFAVPINICAPVIEKLKEAGSFNTPYLGLYAYTAAAARYLKQGSGLYGGLYSAKVDTGGPAFLAGLRYGDNIISINNVDVNTMLELREELYRHNVGDTVEIKYLRNQKYGIAKVTLAGK